MYLTVHQHDMFRTLLMGFEIPFRSYIAQVITSAFPSDNDFEAAMIIKKGLIQSSSPAFLKDILPKECSHTKLSKMYAKFKTAESSTEEIVTDDIEIPMVGALNLATFALTEYFGDLYSLFNGYLSYCNMAESYRYARNKLDHPGSRTLEDIHLVPVLSFVKDICQFLDDSYFLQKTKQQLLDEVTALQQRKLVNPVKIHNFRDMPYGESRIVCRDVEIQTIKEFVYGKPESLRKQHSLCIYGYGGVGKTALVLEALKQIVCDVQDEATINEYSPKYMLFFSAKKRKLALAPETGKFIEQQMRNHFETAEELRGLIQSALDLDSFRKFQENGLIVVDNLETLTLEERAKVKTFVETQTPSEMQFILTSRNSEEYETNYRLAGFDAEEGKTFIASYNEENALDLTLSDEEMEQLVTLAKGNTLVLVLSLRRLSKKLSTVKSLKSEFSTINAWKSLKKALKNTPSNAYEVVAEFMYKDTFEHIESAVSENTELFYKVLKVFAVIQNESTDINTICLLTESAYPDVEAIIDILCNFLIIEKKDTQYSLNSFAEKYIVGRFLPDAEAYQQLSTQINSRQRQVGEELRQLQSDMQDNTKLAKIMQDWLILSDIDMITAAKMYKMYGEVNRACKDAGRSYVQGLVEECIDESDKAESMTAHPFIKYQKARILQNVDQYHILPEDHQSAIKKGFSDSIYAIKTIDQYAGIQQTKSYAALLWLYGQYLADIEEWISAMRYLEEGKAAFEELKNCDEQYYQCATKLGHVYLSYYLQDRESRLVYLRKARSISRMLSADWYNFTKAHVHAGQLKTRLQPYGAY